MKNILGLDIGTNSIGWALIQISEHTHRILASGCRIIPMSQDELSNFDKGQSLSKTAERTRLRTIRRLRERQLLRRERLHRILNKLGFLPSHYAKEIDFTLHPGQFLPGTEPKLAFKTNENNKTEFIFLPSFQEMVADFQQHQPQLLHEGRNIPYNWTIYYLRHKALSQKISKEELAWLLLHFNQKRGYNQLRDEEVAINSKKNIEYLPLLITKVVEGEKKKGETWYSIHLENGLIYNRTSKFPLNWEGTYRDFIITTDLNDDGSVKLDKEGKEKRSLRSPSPDDWMLQKKKAESDIDKSRKTAGSYIYSALLQNPSIKIKGKLIRVVERKYYKSELEAILRTQIKFHQELSSDKFFKSCIEELYPNNEPHRKNLLSKDFVHLLLDDILYYQRPLKSQKSLISNCRFESKPYKKDGTIYREPLKCIPSSHPLFQEFRLWKFIQNIKIIKKESTVDDKLVLDLNVTHTFLPDNEAKASLYEWLNDKKEIDEKTFLKYPGFNLKKDSSNYRWNFLPEKKYPCNETRSTIKAKLKLVDSVPDHFLTSEKETELWHILYSVEDKQDLIKALNTFASKNGLGNDFAVHFQKFPRLEKDYGSYSNKAIKKLLPLMRAGKFWNPINIDDATKSRIDKLLSAEADDQISISIREKMSGLSAINDFSGLPEWLATLLVYNRHSESDTADKWQSPAQIELLKQHSLRNPTVEKIVNETLRVVRDIWIEHGQSAPEFFDSIHVELGREMKNPSEERRKITEQQSNNENTNLRIKALLQELLNDPAIENVRPFSLMQQEILRIYEEGALSSSDVPDDIQKISRLANPTPQQLQRYKLWLEQKYRSPYTGELIPLSRLFTRDYDIEHIIPKSLFYDDSFNNKVICESVVNSEYKDNQLAYTFIKNNEGKTVAELSNTHREVKILSKSAYEELVKTLYANNRQKLKRLLMEEIPDSFIQRQLNDSRYISKLIKHLLSNIVRNEGEMEATTKNVIVSSGVITSILRQDWGLNDIWNQIITPRFERMNEITQSNAYGKLTNKEGKQIFQTNVPLAEQKGFNKKRIDHRHHVLDAIVVACTTRDHVNYLNNMKANDKNYRYDLRQKLCRKKHNNGSQGDYSWAFKQPWDNFATDVISALSQVVPSFRKETKIASKARNRYQTWQKDESGTMKKVTVIQTKGEHWSIRKPLHKDTVSGQVTMQLTKTLSLPLALDNWKKITNKSLCQFIKRLVEEGYDNKKLKDYFKGSAYKWNNQDISKVEVSYEDSDYVATRKDIDHSFDSKKIQKITSSGIRKILSSHLALYNEETGGKIVEHPEMAFSPEGLEELNKNIQYHNGGRPHAPIMKVRVFESKGNKFSVGESGNKIKKFVEAEKGTNLFYGIYKNEKGKRIAETIGLNIAIERHKQGASPVPEQNKDGHPLLFSLSPNDLVYIPDEDEIQEGRINLSLPLQSKQLQKVYKVVSFTGTTIMAIPCQVAKPIVDGKEFSSLNKLQIALNGLSIKDVCVKLSVDRLGIIRQVIQ